MAFLLVFLSTLILSALAVLKFLFAPAGELWPILWYAHLALYSLALVALLKMLLGRLRPEANEANRQTWVGLFLFPFIGLHSLFFTALAVEIILSFFVSLPEAALYSVIFAYTLALVSFLVARMGPKLVHVPLGKGLKILQISDLHIGATLGHNYVEKVVNLAMAANPDCVVFTGDIGDGDPTLHEKSLSELSRLQPPLGIFLVLGNHELYWPTNQWVDFFRRAGMNVLVDEGRTISWQEKELHLFGLGPSGGSTKLPTDEKNLVVLSHYPHHAEDAARANAKLFLAGHTHGGQFWPWSWMIGFFHRYAVGLYQVDETAVYVSSGTGYWGPPFRLGRRAEITLLEIELS